MQSTHSTKGYYEIFGTFFLIVVLVSMTILFIAYQNGFLLFRQVVNEEINDYSRAIIVRERLLTCFGSGLQPARMSSLTCADGAPLDTGTLSKTIRGFHVQTTDLFDCAEEEWEWFSSGTPTETATEFRYSVPVLDESTFRNCLGHMTIFI